MEPYLLNVKVWLILHVFMDVIWHGLNKRLDVKRLILNDYNWYT